MTALIAHGDQDPNPDQRYGVAVGQMGHCTASGALVVGRSTASPAGARK